MGTEGGWRYLMFIQHLSCARPCAKGWSLSPVFLVFILTNYPRFADEDTEACERKVADLQVGKWQGQASNPKVLMVKCS